MNKLRLKFSKNGPIKFIGHLDVMRYFQKAIRRAEIDIKYSEGFSPHPVFELQMRRAGSPVVLCDAPLVRAAYCSL